MVCRERVRATCAGIVAGHPYPPGTAGLTLVVRCQAKQKTTFRPPLFAGLDMGVEVRIEPSKGAKGPRALRLSLVRDAVR